MVKGRKGDLTAKFKALNDVSFDIYDGETVAHPVTIAVNAPPAGSSAAALRVRPPVTA